MTPMMIKVLVFGGLALAIAIALLHLAYFSAAAKKRRAFKRAQRRSVAETTDGMLVKLVGRLQLLDESRGLASPLSERRCAHYQLCIYQRHGKSHRVLVVDEATQDFWLVDETGRALVETAGATILLTVDNQQRSGFGRDATPKLETLLARHGQTSTGWVFNKDLTYTEGTLSSGEVVAVIGRCRVEPDPQAGGGAMRRVICSPSGGEVVITDDAALIGPAQLEPGG